MTVTGLVVVCQLVTGSGYLWVRFLARRRFSNDGIASEAGGLQNQIARRFDEIQFGCRCRERRSLQPILDDPLVFVRKHTVVVHKRVLNSSKAREDANQIKAEGVAEELLSKQLIEAPLRRLQVHSRLRKLRRFVHVLQSSSAPHRSEHTPRAARAEAVERVSGRKTHRRAGFPGASPTGTQGRALRQM